MRSQSATSSMVVALFLTLPACRSASISSLFVFSPHVDLSLIIIKSLSVGLLIFICYLNFSAFVFGFDFDLPNFELDRLRVVFGDDSCVAQ